jgi:hypothetical protein
MKELNDRLAQAYAGVTSLAVFGEETIKIIDPADFALMPNIDRLVSQIIRQTFETVDRPQILIVSVWTAAGWKWYFYDAPFKELTRREFDLDTQNSLLLPGKGNSTILYATRSEFEAKGLLAFVSCLETQPLLTVAIENIFCFLSAELCVSPPTTAVMSAPTTRRS